MNRVQNFGGELNSLKQKSGFTLAEVLITLAIIGVVAALTIPTVMHNYQKRQIEVKLKKAYSVLANTTNLAIKDHGPISGWEFGESSNDDDNHNFLLTYVMPYLNVSRDCGTITNTKNGCTYPIYKLNKEQYYYNHVSKFYLTDGTFIAGSCSASTKQAVIWIDVNGPKKPNIFGIDFHVFKYDLVNGKFRMYTSDINSCSKTNWGTSCTGIIMKNNWKIPTKDEYVNKFGGVAQDYPW